MGVYRAAGEEFYAGGSGWKSRAVTGGHETLGGSLPDGSEQPRL
jgi:hypothetical protein